MKPLVLASTSVYRAALIKKLGIVFQSVAPAYDEDTEKLRLEKQQASPLLIAETLSRGKALSAHHNHATTLAGDQLVHMDGSIFGKSHNFENACVQLNLLQGRTHELITAVTIMSANQTFHTNQVTRLTMKNLTRNEIENYLRLDQPYDCAGSYKIENSGIILFDKIETDDFTGIQGIPLIWVANVLKELKYEFFQT